MGFQRISPKPWLGTAAPLNKVTLPPNTTSPLCTRLVQASPRMTPKLLNGFIVPPHRDMPRLKTLSASRMHWVKEFPRIFLKQLFGGDAPPIKVSPVAQHNLGVMYSNGQGIPQDYAEAVVWYRRAADHGYAKAQFNLGLMYYRGKGVPRDYVAAYTYFSLAVNTGLAVAENARDQLAANHDARPDR